MSRDPLSVWSDGLPALVADLSAQWDLRLTGEAMRSGYGGLAVPVTRSDGTPAILKLTYVRADDAPGLESSAGRDAENDVLAAWDGRGAARLLERDDLRHARLLQRLGAESLFDRPDAVLAMSVAGSLAARLAVAPPPGLDRLADLAPRLATDLGAADPDRCPTLTPRDLQAAARTYRDLGADQPDTLLHGDLHGRNVLRSPDGDWAVIDPLGLVGEVAIEALTMVRDRWTTLPGESSPRSALLRQLDAFAEAAGTPRQRVLAWTHARAVRAVVAGVTDDGGLHAWVATTLADDV